jgi:hypothetical protein
MRMSTLAEIEAAVDKLPQPEQAALLEFVAKRLREGGGRNRQPRRELLAKWRGRGTGVVEQSGGTQGYLNTIRDRDEDVR